LGGGGTIIDANLKTIRAHVVGAYALPPVHAPAVPKASDAVIREDGAMPILSFQPGRFDGPYVAGDGIALYSFSSEAAALRYCQALRREGAEPVALAENALGQWRPILPGENAAPVAPAPAGPAPELPVIAAPADVARLGFATFNPATEALTEAPAYCYPPAAPAPELPAFVTRSQQQQQPQQGGQWRSPARGGRVAWDEPGESAEALAAEARRFAPMQAIHCQPVPAPQAYLAPAGPAPVVAPGPLARKVAPARLPADVVALLQRFDLSMEGLLTVGASNGKLAKGVAQAWPVILHHLPARALAQAVAGPAPGTTAPRSRIDGLQALARRTDTLALAMAHNGCPWASAGCAAGCLAWAGHGGLSVTVAAARARRTLAMLAGGPTYTRAILWALARAYRQAQAKGLPLAYRLRGTDDQPWHLARLTITPAEAQALARRYGLPVAPGEGITLTEALALAPAGSIRPYDYSAAPVDGPLGLKAQRAAGIDTTCSLKADRTGGIDTAIQAVGAGFRVAVPVALAKGQPLPAVLILESGGQAVDLACIDGDASDHRWADPAGPGIAGGCDGVAVILKTKRSRGKGPEADAFSLLPVIDVWQPLAGGGRAMLRSQPWGR
jgi:hypothetical protein